MSNLFVDLPVPSKDGVGPWVDVSRLGGQKTLRLGFPADAGENPMWAGVVAIEATLSDDAEAIAEICQLSGPCQKAMGFSARLMRATVRGHKYGQIRASIAGDSRGTRWTSLPVPDTDGPGEFVEVGGFGSETTVIVSNGPWTGSLNIQCSDGEGFSDVVTFPRGGHRIFKLQGRLLRVYRSGVVPSSLQYVPHVDVGAANDIADVGAFEVTRDGKFVGARTRLNLSGPGVIATDDPDHDRVNIAISGAGETGSALLTWRANSVGAAADRRYLHRGFDTLASLKPTGCVMMTRPGVLRNLAIVHGQALPEAVMYRIWKNGSPTDLCASVPANKTSGQDAMRTVTVEASDVVELVVEKSLPMATGIARAVASVELS